MELAERRIADMPAEDPPISLLEARMLEAERMDAVGRLAGGVAQDFNNLLTIIGGYARFADATLQDIASQAGGEAAAWGLLKPRLAQAHADLGVALAAAERAASLTSKLLAFGRHQVLQPLVLDPSAVIAGLAPLLRRVVGPRIVLAVGRAPKPARVRFDRARLEHVLVALAENAADAMPAGGRIAIRVSTLEVDPADADSPAPAGYSADGAPALPPGPYVRITVADTGRGMDAATARRAFEPFFTTKPVGDGHGLGLAMVLGTVRQSGGRITCDSTPGEGTTFTIDLPRVELPLGEAPKTLGPKRRG